MRRRKRRALTDLHVLLAGLVLGPPHAGIAVVYLATVDGGLVARHVGVPVTWTKSV